MHFLAPFQIGMSFRGWLLRKSVRMANITYIFADVLQLLRQMVPIQIYTAAIPGTAS